MTDEYFGRFSAILPAGPGPSPDRPEEEAPRKKREPQTRFTCLLPLPEPGQEIPVFGTGRRRKAAEPTVAVDPTVSNALTGEAHPEDEQKFLGEP